MSTSLTRKLRFSFRAHRARRRGHEIELLAVYFARSIDAGRDPQAAGIASALAGGTRAYPGRCWPARRSFGRVPPRGRRVRRPGRARGQVHSAATRGSPEPTPREVLTHGASTSSSILNLSPRRPRSPRRAPALAPRLGRRARVLGDGRHAREAVSRDAQATGVAPRARVIGQALAPGANGDKDKNDPSASGRAWDIAHCVCVAVAPTDVFAPFVGEFLAVRDERRISAPADRGAQAAPPPRTRRQGGPTKTPPPAGALRGVALGDSVTTPVYFLDETFEELTFDALTTVADATPSVAGTIRLREYATFGLFADAVASADADDADDADTHTAHTVHVALADTELICDVLQDLKGPRRTQREKSKRRPSARNPFKTFQTEKTYPERRRGPTRRRPPLWRPPWRSALGV